MNIITKNAMPNGTKIQIEDWSSEYEFMPMGCTLAAYPRSLTSHDGQFAPKRGRKLRVSFNFRNYSEAKIAFAELVRGDSELSDFEEFINNPNHIDCI